MKGSWEESNTLMELMDGLVNDLYVHIASTLGIRDELCNFLRSWILCLLGSFVPLDSMKWIMNSIIFTGIKGFRHLVLTLLIYLKDELLSI